MGEFACGCRLGYNWDGFQGSKGATVVRAATGYGQSMALTTLIQSERPLVWYHLDKADADPSVFLLHLIHVDISDTAGQSSERSEACG